MATRARDLFERAIELAPDFSRAYTGLAYSHHRDMLFRTPDSRDKKLSALLEAARQAVKLDEHDSFAQMELGIALILAEQFEEAIGQFERAIALNPSNAIAHAALGQAMTLLGRPDEAIPYLERAFRINPQDPRNHIYFAFMARAHLTARRYEEAVRWSRDAAQRHSKIPNHICCSPPLWAILVATRNRVPSSIPVSAWTQAMKTPLPGRTRIGTIPTPNTCSMAFARQAGKAESAAEIPNCPAGPNLG